MRFKYLIVICAALSVCISAMAKDNAEDRHVRAILFSGDTIEGYLRNDLKTGLKNIFQKQAPYTSTSISELNLKEGRQNAIAQVK